MTFPYEIWASSRSVRQLTVRRIPLVSHPAGPGSRSWKARYGSTAGAGGAAGMPAGRPIPAPPVSPLNRSLYPVPVVASPSNQMASPPRSFAVITGTNASTAMALPVTEEVAVVLVRLLANLKVRRAPVTATDAGLMVVEV